MVPPRPSSLMPSPPARRHERGAGRLRLLDLVADAERTRNIGLAQRAGSARRPDPCAKHPSQNRCRIGAPDHERTGGGDNIACQRGANIGRWFAQRSAFCCRAAPPGKAADSYGFPRKNLVGVRGFEPPAPASRKQCSTRLSYTPPTEREI